MLGEQKVKRSEMASVTFFASFVQTFFARFFPKTQKVFIPSFVVVFFQKCDCLSSAFINVF